MVVHALRGCGHGPRLPRRRRRRARPASNAGWGAGEWVVVEADESDRSLLKLAPRVAVLTNAELDHHATYASQRDVDETFRAFLARAREGDRRVGPAASCARSRRVAGADPCELVAYDVPEPAPSTPGGVALRLARHRGRSLRSPAPTTRSTPPPRWRPRGSPAPTRPRRPRRSPTSQGAGRRFELLGATRDRRAGLRRLRPPPDRGRRDDRAPRARSARSASSPSSSRTCTRARARSRASSGARSRAADLVVVLDVYAARERAGGLPRRRRQARRRRGRRRRRRAHRRLAARASTTPSRSCAPACAPATSASRWAPATSTRSAAGW